MKHASKTLATLVCAMLIVGAAESARASIGPKWSDDQLVDLSAVVLTGRVVSIASGWDSSVNTIYTYVTLDVNEVLKGYVNTRRVVFKQAGGIVGEIGLHVNGQARFAVGEDVLLFAEVRPRDHTLYTTALWQGKWTLEIDPSTGRRSAVRYDPEIRDGNSEIDRRDYGPMHDAITARSAQDSRTEDFVPVPSETPVGSTSNPFALLDSPARWMAQPVQTVIQSGGQPGLGGGGIAQLQTALNQWNGVLGGAFTFNLASLAGAPRRGTTFADSNLNTWVANDPFGEISNSGGTLAVCFSWFTTAVVTTVNGVGFRQLRETIVIGNDSAVAQQFLTNANCFQQVFLHEFGHALGLGHTPVSTAVMFATVSFAQCSAGALPPQPDDIAGGQFIYPGGGGVTPPSAAPGNVQVTVNGTVSLTVTFTPVASDGESQPGAATSYRLDFRQTFPGPILATLTAPNSPVVVPIPPGVLGTFNVTVTGLNSAGAGPSSPPVNFTIGGAGCLTPAQVTGVTGGISPAGIATVSWNAAANATTYIVQAGSGIGLSNLFNANVGATTVVTAGPLPPGFQAFVRIIGVNACGTPGPASAPDFLVK